ncbi:MAG: NACHT domain-containing protein [Mojavia pulchra JT2-VF2]|jgi:predicted NACHT family NTPase|uniref:NACHT domain-containing protein n=1 Tax=Mojavia pulchra JT2-VF2 TaxID=287848 RepID=A0A951UJN5_9NOST|nr:NACHT domain-containing protein [Mojavia pulchra JT2-VF2]
MTRRSLQASAEGVSKAEAALIRNSLTQQGLAGELGISRQPVTKFFQGKPVDRYIFVTICEKLNLNWEEIITASSFPHVEEAAKVCEIKSLVQIAREKIHESIQRRCGVMRVLDMEQPMRLDAIYTDVNFLERVARNRRLDIEEMSRNFDAEHSNPFDLGILQQKRLPALEIVERYDKLIILGKPGTGKTTFLKWLAIECNLSEFQGDRLWRCAPRNRVPIFISLKDFAETRGQPSLLEYITQQFEDCGFDVPNAAETILMRGQAIILLDGLDEVQEAEFDRVLQDIRKVATRFYSCFIVITCRVAAINYIFEQFTEVEIADFAYQQIADFATKWFQVNELMTAERFLHKLQENQPLQELANNPLLLTLLCLIFEQRGDFPAQQSEIYQEALHIFLKKWDAQRHIERFQIYKQISPKQEELLSQIAYTTKEQNKYFFKQEVIEQEISGYICDLAHANTALELLQLDSKAILKSIEAQYGLLVERARGIYSFSHITFQEYLAGKHTKQSMH